MLCLFNHCLPGLPRLFQPNPAVVEGIVDEQHVGFVGQHISLETGGTLLGIFAPDGRHQHVDDRVRIAVFQAFEQLIWVRAQGIDDRRFEIAGRNAVAVK